MNPRANKATAAVAMPIQHYGRTCNKMLRVETERIGLAEYVLIFVCSEVGRYNNVQGKSLENTSSG